MPGSSHGSNAPKQIDVLTSPIVVRPSGPQTAAVLMAGSIAVFGACFAFVGLAFVVRSADGVRAVALACLFACVASVVAAVIRARQIELVVSEEAVTVKNFLRRRRLCWEEVTEVTWGCWWLDRVVRGRRATPLVRFHWGGGRVFAAASAGKTRWVWEPKDMTVIHAIHEIAGRRGIPSSLGSFPAQGY